MARNPVFVELTNPNMEQKPLYEKVSEKRFGFSKSGFYRNIARKGLNPKKKKTLIRVSTQVQVLE